MPRALAGRALAAMLLAVLIFAVGTAVIPGFATPFSLRAMLVLAAFLAIASVGQTLVMLLGGIDLAIPFVIGFANVAAAQLTGEGWPFPVVVLLVLAGAGLIGAFNGALSAGIGIHPLIVTLGVGTAVQGGVLLWTAGFPSGSAPAFVTRFVSIGGTIGPLPFPWLIPFAALVLAGVAFVLRRTVYGRRLYALGSNPTAAPLALIRPVRMWTVTYAASAVFAAVAGILLLGFTGSAFAAVGQPYLFQTVAAVVIGGTAITGGRGGYVGTVIGAFVLIELTTLLIGLGLSQALVQAALGLVIILLVSAYGREPDLRTQI